jgi:hypothetical protein
MWSKYVIWHIIGTVWRVSTVFLIFLFHLFPTPPPAWGRILVYVHVMYQGAATQQPAFFLLCSASVVEWGRRGCPQKWFLQNVYKQAMSTDSSPPPPQTAGFGLHPFLRNFPGAEESRQLKSSGAWDSTAYCCLHCLPIPSQWKVTTSARITTEKSHP